ncbi:MAG: hypothetical protein J7L94_13300 [Caldisericaceae bacterium]|nr:hypothetical protein [Caldisericaceae bacterium]
MLNIGDNKICLDFGIEENKIIFNFNNLDTIHLIIITEEDAIRITEDGNIRIADSLKA